MRLPSLFAYTLCLFAASLCGCGKREAASTQSKTSADEPSAVLRVSQRNEPADLDPALATLPDEVALLRALGEGLLIPGPNGGAPLPGIAERFEVSADGLVYTFHLRANLRWSNDEPVTAEDLVASYRRVLTPATAAPRASVFFAVKNARAFLTGKVTDFSEVGLRTADTRTLVVTLEQPNARFPYYVASGPWIPVNPRVVAKHGRAWTKPENHVSNGPFTLVEWRPHQHLLLRRNRRWHGAANVQLSELRFVHFDNGDAEERAYRAGQIDVTLDVPKTKIETYATERPAELHRATMIETRYLSINCQRAPLNDPRVRRALALAIDREAIVTRVLRGGHAAATRFVPPPLQASVVPGPASAFAAATHTHNPAEARRLLAEAGFANGANFPRFEVTAWSQSQVATLEAIQAMWKRELGIEVTLATRDAKVHMSALAGGNYDIGFIIAIPDVADAANLLGDYTSTSPDNYPQWRDAGYDALIAEATAERDPAAQSAKLAAAEARLLEAAAVCPLYFNLKIWLMSPRVQNWSEDGLWARTYHQVRLAPAQ